uniref:Uncharacterized protein n=1 Tax=Amphimedon queenslandica TaxID=400682 RepID=A0A1X7VII2_AMPQE
MNARGEHSNEVSDIRGNHDRPLRCPKSPLVTEHITLQSSQSAAKIVKSLLLSPPQYFSSDSSDDEGLKWGIDKCMLQYHQKRETDFCPVEDDKIAPEELVEHLKSQTTNCFARHNIANMCEQYDKKLTI